MFWDEPNGSTRWLSHYNVMYIEGFNRNPSLFIAVHSLIQYIPFLKDRFYRK